jgi:ribulose-5-phosphate 4-epimerase/fuculose-1-phosphate aldolase
MFKDFQQLTIKIVDLVNSPRKTQRIIRDATIPRMILKEFVESLKAMDAKGFLLGSFSEVSLRAKGGKLVITPENLPMNRMTEESLQTAAIHPDIVNQKMSFPRHIDWHRMIYLTSEANAVVLCQPTFTCIFANKMQIPASDIINEAAAIIDSIKSVKSTDVCFGKDENLGEEGTLLIQSVGILAWGKNLDDVFSRIEVLERICKIQISAGSA